MNISVSVTPALGKEWGQLGSVPLVKNVVDKKQIGEISYSPGSVE